ncbi:hypothetical protein DICPUDRAFT_74807 [Dictyostelium purpureum]|uniref:Uncharacterized protein n=1 Tax=Dictyostelium purpureum TaxID=5786 RepID=F0Z8T1_DICPU|nr:uncharacterized protein DICPUDRAFT_74807 [Dictyostelium purpureum]EGC39627.1 hypothetical protein DICPUDRAFT_74807 [Dictyostelium purpureum]|eukprot:XP_003283848.1 hypothetical protein DICPUDRAFT_74807 [Dictyostelium purpureum]
MKNSKVFLRILNNTNSINNKVIYNNFILKSINNFKVNNINNNDKSFSIKSLSSQSIISNNYTNIKYNKSFFSTQINENKDLKKDTEVKKDTEEVKPEETKQEQNVEGKKEEIKQEEIKKEETKQEETKQEETKQEETKQEENKQEENNNNNNNNKEEKPKTLKEKIISKTKWTLIIGSIVGSIGFLFYESYLRNTLPYRMTMNYLDKDDVVLKNFGGHITGIKWYKCFTNPIFGWVQNEEGGMASWTYLRIPITRYVAPPLPKSKEGEPEIIPISLPEDAIFKGHDRGAQVGIVYVKMVKRSPNFYDWVFEDLQVHCDNNQIIKVVDSEKNKIIIDYKRRK